MLSLLALLLTQATAQAAPQAPALQCQTGPLHKAYGGTPWLLYSCSDLKTLVVVSDKGNPASPFYFVFHPVGDGYEISGEGNGSKTASGAAFEDLKKLGTSDIVAIVEQTKVVPKP